MVIRTGGMREQRSSVLRTRGMRGTVQPHQTFANPTDALLRETAFSGRAAHKTQTGASAMAGAAPPKLCAAAGCAHCSPNSDWLSFVRAHQHTTVGVASLQIQQRAQRGHTPCFRNFTTRRGNLRFRLSTTSLPFRTPTLCKGMHSIVRRIATQFNSTMTLPSA